MGLEHDLKEAHVPSTHTHAHTHAHTKRVNYATVKPRCRKTVVRLAHVEIGCAIIFARMRTTMNHSDGDDGNDDGDGADDGDDDDDDD